MKIGFIGAGRVGSSMGRYLSEKGAGIAGYYDASGAAAVEAADFTGTDSFSDLEQLVSLSDTLFITTPDGIIGEVWDCIKKMSIHNKIVCHCSGSLSSEVFSGIESTGASGCSIHPMLAFADKFTSYEQLNNAFLTIEGQEHALSVMKNFFAEYGNLVCEIDSGCKAKYHAAASILSNQVVAVLDAGYRLLTECGFSPMKAVDATEKLVLGNVKNICDKGPVNALTGPIERGDVGTVRKHLEVLEEEDRQMYIILAKKLVRIAAEKNPSKDYGEMRRYLDEEYSSNF